MTVSTQVKQAVASMKSAQASLESFALETQDQSAKQIYSNAAQQLKTIINSVEPRVNQIETEEPQYKGF
ncbi:MAG: DUF1657 domain-containing protein [Bacillaceae bacterium]|nr:DUF1657 domain-containing protein [Bacillaceae bacterium]